jgi:hypothetical protein
MTTQDRKAAAHQPPTPGGDPDQPSNDVPNPPRKPAEPSEHRNKSGFGHIGNNDEPRPDGAPPPHQIF